MAINEEIFDRICGAAWNPVRPLFMKIHDTLLAVSPDATAELTTIYVKYNISLPGGVGVYAVVWLKSSREIVVGLSLPKTTDATQSLIDPPKGFIYKGLTKYFRIGAGDQVPAKMPEWANDAHRHLLDNTR